MYLNFIFVSFLSIFSLSCNQNVNYSNIFELAENHRSNAEFMLCIKNLNQIINECKDNNLRQRAQFLIADIYMNDVKNYPYALDEFRKVLSLKIDNNLNKKSLFMYSYICSNYLDMYTDAYDSYKVFLELYPNDELVPSVLYEIDQLEPMLITAKKLINS